MCRMEGGAGRQIWLLYYLPTSRGPVPSFGYPPDLPQKILSRVENLDIPK